MSDAQNDIDLKLSEIDCKISTIGNGVCLSQSTLGDDCGWGLFADKDFNKNEIITAYYGQVINHKQANILKQEQLDSHVATLFPMYWHIDGRKHENGTLISDPLNSMVGKPGGAFINHSKKPNTEFDRIHCAGLCLGDDINPNHSRLVIRALVPIKKGQELFISYGVGYWKNRNIKCVT